MISKDGVPFLDGTREIAPFVDRSEVVPFVDRREKFQKDLERARMWNLRNGFKKPLKRFSNGKTQPTQP